MHTMLRRLPARALTLAAVPALALSLSVVVPYDVSAPLWARVALAKKSDEVYGVHYSYERQSSERGGEQRARYVLMPRSVMIPKDKYGDFKERMRALFDALKANKSGSYGKAAFAAEGEVVFVFLDPEKEVNAPFIIAEAVYTFTEAGAKGVSFRKIPKYEGRDYTKSDIRYPAYQLVLPYWEGLPPAQTAGALLSLSDGTLITPSTLAAQLRGSDPKLVEELKASLSSGDLDAAEAVVAAVELMRAEGVSVKGISAGLLPMLSLASAELRTLALRGLDGVDEPEVNTTLRKLMDSDDEEEALRAKAAALLSKAKDPNFSEAAQFYALRAKDPAVVITAAEGLARAKSKEATPELLKALKREEPAVRAAALKSLFERKAQRELVAALGGELPLATKVEVAEALCADRDLKVQESALEHLVRQPDGAAAARAARSLVGVKGLKSAYALLTEALRHPEGVARVAAAEAVASLGGASALKALSEANIDDPESGDAVHDAMRAVYAKEKEAFVSKEAQQQSAASLRSAAAGALGVHYRAAKGPAQKKLFELIKRLASDSEAWVRGEAARSLGDVGGAEAQAELLKLTQDGAVEVQRLVSLALRAFPEAVGREYLQARLADAAPEGGKGDVKLAVNALDTLGLLVSVESLASITPARFLEHADARVRRAAVGALAALAPSLTGKARDGVVPKLEPRLKDSDEEVTLRAARGLGEIPTGDAEFHLNANMQSGGQALSLAVVAALIKHNSKGAAESLASAMDLEDAKVREAAYRASSAMTHEEARAELKRRLTRRLEREQDAGLKGLIEAQLKGL
jgi:HEAT repeat protein